MFKKYRTMREERADGGFTLIGTLGWAGLINGRNVDYLAGNPTKEDREGIDIAFGGGLVIGTAIGYSFR